jgi:hypothetical protein
VPLTHQEFGMFGWRTAHGRDLKTVSFACPESAEIGLAESEGLFQHGIEHRREIAGRRVDDLQDFGGGGLALKSLITLNGALVQPLLRIGKLTLEIVDGLLQIV